MDRARINPKARNCEHSESIGNFGRNCGRREPECKNLAGIGEPLFFVGKWRNRSL